MSLQHVTRNFVINLGSYYGDVPHGLQPTVLLYWRRQPELPGVQYKSEKIVLL